MQESQRSIGNSCVFFLAVADLVYRVKALGRQRIKSAVLTALEGVGGNHHIGNRLSQIQARASDERHVTQRPKVRESGSGLVVELAHPGVARSRPAAANQAPGNERNSLGMQEINSTLLHYLCSICVSALRGARMDRRRARQ